MVANRPPQYVPKQQADATLTQNNPISGTKYTILDTVTNARIISISAKCLWTVQPSPLEVHITIDGQPINCYKNDPATDTSYYGITYEPDSTNPLSDAITANSRAFFLEGRKVKIELEITGGTVQSLVGRVKYQKW